MIQTLKLDPVTRHIPILLCSAEAKDVAERTGGLDAMANVEFLAKPFTAEALTALLDKMLAVTSYNRADAVMQPH